MMIFNQIQPKIRNTYQWLESNGGNTVRIVKSAIQHFSRVNGAEAAASIAYYAIFSLFPLLLFLIAVVGYLLLNVPDPARVLDNIIAIFPTSGDFLRKNLLQILESRNTGGIVGLIGLGWAASGVFLTLTRNINRAWARASSRNFFHGRIIALGMVGILTILLVLSFVATTIVNLLPNFIMFIPGSISIYDTSLWRLLTSLASWFFVFIIFISLYRWAPNTRVRWREAFWGAALATIAWEITTWLFAWFLGSGWARYELIYGSLGTILALLTWIYLTAWITLFGAHLCSAVARVTRNETRLATEGANDG